MKKYKLLLVALLQIFFLQTFNVTPATAQQLKPGDIAPNAKYLDVDVMNEFNNGAAIVQKGNSHALIDKNGNFVVPFNKYEFNFFELGDKGVYNGIFTLDLGHEALNTKGELIGKGLTFAPRGKSDGPYRLALVRGGLMAINSGNQQFLVKGPQPSGITTMGNFSEGLMSFLPVAGKKKREYRNLKDEVVIPALYDFTSPFSNGMALIGNNNEFGEMKYGFVSADGTEIVSPIYSNKPTDFTCGRSLVYPKNNTEFEYAFINRKGNIAIKYTKEMSNKYGNFYTYFYNGYTFNSRYVMDTSGKIFSYPAFFAKCGVSNPTDKSLALLFPTDRETWTEGQVFTYTRNDVDPRSMRTGFIDVVTNKVVEGPFMKTGQFFFDPVSKLAYAEAIVGESNSGHVIRKGYINMQGMFVIIQGDGSKW